MKSCTLSSILLAIVCVSGSPLYADSPTPPPTPELSEKALEAKWASIGDIGPLYPVQEATDAGRAMEMHLGVPPHLDGEKVNSWAQVLPSITPSSGDYESLPDVFSNNPSEGKTKLYTYPVLRDFINTYMAATAQAIFGSEFTSTPGNREFSGAAFTSVFAVPLEQASDVDIQKAKDVIGYQTVYHKSQPSMDSAAVGGFNAVHATLNLSVKETEGESSEWKMKRWFVDLLCGGLSEARLSAPQESGSDGRILQGINQASLSIKFMLGCTTLVHYDAPTVPKGAELVVIAPPNLPPDVEPPSLGEFADLPGLMEKNRKSVYARAPSIQIELFKWILNSYLHVGQARGATARLELSGESGTSSPSTAERRIGHWKGLQYSAHSTSPTNVETSDFGLKVEDQTFEGSNLTALYPSFTSTIPDHLSVMSAGVHVLGDGTADRERSGYSTDVVHVRDIIRLPMFSAAPPTADTELGTIVYAKKIAAGSGTYAPGLYICLLDSNGLRTWRRLSYDLNGSNASVVAARIHRSNGKQVVGASGYQVADISQRIQEMAEESAYFNSIRITARIEESSGKRTLRAWARGPINPWSQLSVRRIDRSGGAVEIATQTASSEDQEIEYSSSVEDLLPVGWIPRSLSDIHNGVPPTKIRFEVTGGAPAPPSFLEVFLE